MLSHLPRLFAPLGHALVVFAILLVSPRISRADSGPREVRICSNLVFTHQIDPELSPDEKRLACGSGSGEGDIVPEWRDIPASQREFHLKTFLQARGYLSPKFEVRPGELRVNPGRKREVSRIDVYGAPKRFSYRRKRGVIGSTLTPNLLDELKSWTTERLRGLGYACPMVNLQADSENGVITVQLEPGPRGRLVNISGGDVPGLLPGLFRRYDMFEMPGWFNGDLLNLTSQRVTGEGQVESFKLYVDHCLGKKVYARQEVIAGKPRLLRLGAGVNTEGLLLARAEWKDVRLGKAASYIDLQLQATGTEQTFSALAHWYVLPWVSRWYLQPASSTDHQHQEPYETLLLRQEFTAQTTYDTDALGYHFGFGPVYEYVNTIRGPGAPSSRFLLFEPTFRVASHYFDYYQASPRTGFSIGLTGDFSQHQLYSDYTSDEIILHTEALWNYRQYSPPLIVFGLRGQVATTFTEGNAFTSQIPPTMRQYLGGSTSLRGFGLLELPKDQIGRLTSVYGGFETRLVGELPIGLQPFVLLDAGALGSDSLDLEKPVYWSPGIGLRDETPIGIFRLTLAHGYLTGNPDPSLSHFQLFFSYGEEF